MEIFTDIFELQNKLKNLRKPSDNQSIGFVPTMGALHEGHLHLIDQALKNSDRVICSIFVNPTQFNDKKDLQKYPVKTEEDLAKLKAVGCDIVFLPSIEQMYPVGADEYKIDLGILDSVMEGKFRPGHFKGVAMVVERFFRIIQPDKAFFGKKDFQQLAVIKKMVALRGLQVQVIPVEIVRSEQGLALSSRNERLSDQQKEEALIIYKTLVKGKQIAAQDPTLKPSELQERLTAHFLSNGKLRLEYLEVVDSTTLLPALTLKNSTCCIAAYCGEVRLIDNMQLE